MGVCVRTYVHAFGCVQGVCRVIKPYPKPSPSPPPHDHPHAKVISYCDRWKNAVSITDGEGEEEHKADGPHDYPHYCIDPDERIRLLKKAHTIVVHSKEVLQGVLWSGNWVQTLTQYRVLKLIFFNPRSPRPIREANGYYQECHEHVR